MIIGIVNIHTMALLIRVLFRFTIRKKKSKSPCISHRGLGKNTSSVPLLVSHKATALGILMPLNETIKTRPRVTAGVSYNFHK